MGQSFQPLFNILPSVGVSALQRLSHVRTDELLRDFSEAEEKILYWLNYQSCSFMYLKNDEIKNAV